MKSISEFKSIIEVVNYFADESFCMKYLEEERWGGKVKCAFCSHDKVYRVEKYKRFKCAKCAKQFNAMTGRLFQGKRISLQKWFVGIFIFNTLPAISSYRMAKELGVTQKTAWYMLQRLRYGLDESEKEETVSMIGPVSVDETFVGGKNKNRHKGKKVEKSQGRSFKDKTPVLGIMEKEVSTIIVRPNKRNPLVNVKEKVVIKGARLKCFVIPNTQIVTIQPIIHTIVSEGSVLISDEWKAYRGLNRAYDHRIVNHKTKEYVNENGDTTNDVECSWALFKRGLQVYYHVSRKHLSKYVGEFVFKYNTRLLSQKEKFNEVLNRVKYRVTYSQLTAN